jgi:coenzyme Q-binding protein COQ10
VTRFSDRRTLRFAPEQIFALVADVERYPEFLPWCTRLKIRERREEGASTILVADMTISFALVQERFTSKVVLTPQERRIEVDYLDGPFRYLHNLWRFEPTPGGCVVHFDIDFEFKNRALGLLIGTVFHKAVQRLVHAFEARAEALYGRVPAGTAVR